MMNLSVRKIVYNSSNALRVNWSQAFLRYSSRDTTTGNKEFPPKGTEGHPIKKSNNNDNINNKEPLIKDQVFSVRVRGVDLMNDPAINKNMAFTLKERQLMGIHGLLPPVFKTQDEQVEWVKRCFERRGSDLDRYIFLMGIQDRNEKLFFRVINQYIEDMLPIVYTPTIGLVCREYGVVYRKPRGLFITIHDRGHVYEILSNWPHDEIKAIVVTDGERILGYGDLGAFGMGIPVGKLSLYTAFARIPPQHCLPIVIDCGINNDKYREDPLYIGLPQKRDKGPNYFALMDEFMDAVVRRYGPNCLVQFEDFESHNAFKFLDRYRNKYCTFNDDIQGTAAVTLSGILASLRITGTRLVDNTYLFLGAGGAGFGVAQFLFSALRKEGLSEQDAYSRIWLFDKDGLIVRDRPEGGINEMHKPFAKDLAPIRCFEAAIHHVKPTAIIGTSGIGGLFTPAVLRAMAQHNNIPIIFALSNPNEKAECTVEDAYRYTNERCVYASGSPFGPVTTEGGRTVNPSQCNNAYIFPGVALAVIMCDIPRITEEMFIIAAKTLSEMVTEEHLKEGRIYPPLNEIRNVSLRIAGRIAEHCYTRKEARHLPEPSDKEAFLRSKLYSTDYESFEPNVYAWPPSTAK